MTQENTLPALSEANKAMTVSDAMASTGISSNDVVVPKLLLMQNTSESVGDGKVQMGDIVNSENLEVLGNDKSPVEVIPLRLYKTWRVYDTNINPPKFVAQYPVTPKNEKQDWEGVESINGENIPVRRDLCFNFFVLLSRDVESGDGFPHVISFKRTSMQAGRQLATHLFKKHALGKLPFIETVKIAVKKDKKDKNTYAVLQIEKGNPTTEAGLVCSKEWIGVLDNLMQKVDEQGEEIVDYQARKSNTQVSAPADIY